MTLDVTFEEIENEIDIEFEQINNVSDGGYERGYASGYEAGNGKAIVDVINKTITELVNDEIKSLVQYLFDSSPNLQKVKSSSLTSVGIQSLANCPKLVYVDCPSITSVGTRGFAYSGIKSIHFPLLGYVGNGILLDCTDLEWTRFDAPTAFSALCFSGCIALRTLVITKKSVCPLQNINCLENTPIANGNGYIYVPADLVDAYKSATNWSIYANQIRAIEDYPEIVN